MSETVLSLVYLAGAAGSFGYTLWRDRREQPWLSMSDSAMLAFAFAMFWPLVLIFMACVVVGLLVQDRRRGAR